MYQNRPILFLRLPCEEAVLFVVQRMQQAGLTVMRTFDLHETRVEHTGCSCQHHGTDQCDCQMVVLLVYGKDTSPVSLIAHGHSGQTWFSLAEYFGATNTRLEAQICGILSSADIDPAAQGLD